MQEFSTAIGWQRNKTARIMNGVQEPNSEEMRTIAELFHLSSDEFIDIFLKTSSQSELMIAEIIKHL